MGEPLTRTDPAAGTGEGPVADAARRLEQALTSLEGSVKRTLAGARLRSDAETPAPDPTLLADLEAVRGRERELEGAAAAASDALGHAMAEIQRVLAADAAASSQGELDLGELDLGASGQGALDRGEPDFQLETEAPLADDDDDAAGDAPEKDPA